MSMEKVEHCRRQPGASLGVAAPRMLRSKSGGAAAMSSLPKPNLASKSSKTSGSGEIPRPKETKTRKKPETADSGGGGGGGGGGFIMFLPRTASKNKIEVPRRTRSASTSPSAWALSPGRSLSCASPAAIHRKQVPKAISPETMMKPEGGGGGGGGGGGVGGILRNYLRQAKASRSVEKEYHAWRVAYNRLMQWRFTNARADASTAAANWLAQKKMYHAWIRNSCLRKLTVEKRLQVAKLKQDIKVDQILNSEMVLLNQWWRMEPRNMEAVGRVIRKLSALSYCVPLVKNAKGDVISVSDAVAAATGVMEKINATIIGPSEQVEKMCFLLTELSVMVRQHEYFMEELEKRVALVAAMQVQEESLRVQHIHMVEEESQPRIANEEI